MAEASLKQALRAAVAGAFEGLGDLAMPLIYQSLTGEVVRDIAAGTVTPVARNFRIPRGVFTRFRENEIDSNVSLLEDSKLLIPAQYLPVEPKAADLVIERKTKKVWEIQRRLQDPAEAVISLHVRTSKKVVQL